MTISIHDPRTTPAHVLKSWTARLDAIPYDQYLDILRRVKNLHPIPQYGVHGLNTTQVMLYFTDDDEPLMSRATLTRMYQRHNMDFVIDGTKMVSAKSGGRTIIWTARGMCRLAFLLRERKIAKQIKAILLTEKSSDLLQ